MASHPIQYHAIWWRTIASRPDVDLRVAFADVPDGPTWDPGFAHAFTWDVPLTEGYSWTRCGAGGVMSLLREWRPNAVLVTGWHVPIVRKAALEAKLLRIPCVVRGDSNGMEEAGSFRRLRHALLLGLYDAVLAVGVANERFYRDRGVPADRVFPAPYFVDNRWFEERAATLATRREELRSRWDIPPDRCCFVFAGKLEPRKRVLDLMEAIAICGRDGARARALVVGSGEQGEEARHLAQSLGLPVTFAGFLNQTEIVEAFVAADCLVLPSSFEPWGLVVNEAMACGLPAIVSDRVGCWPDLVPDGTTGAVYPCGDVTSLAGRMGELAGDAGRRAEASMRAREKVAMYSPEAAADGLVAAVASVCEG